MLLPSHKNIGVELSWNSPSTHYKIYYSKFPGFKKEEAKTITCPHCGRRVDPVEAADTARADIW